MQLSSGAESAQRFEFFVPPRSRHLHSINQIIFELDIFGHIQLPSREACFNTVHASANFLVEPSCGRKSLLALGLFLTTLTRKEMKLRKENTLIMLLTGSSKSIFSQGIIIPASANIRKLRISWKALIFSCNFFQFTHVSFSELKEMSINQLDKITTKGFFKSTQELCYLQKNTIAGMDAKKVPNRRWNQIKPRKICTAVTEFKEIV